MPGRQVVDAAPDLAPIAEHLQISKLATWGYSGDGPHALSCAARLPRLVVAAVVVHPSLPTTPTGSTSWLGRAKATSRSSGPFSKGEEAIRTVHEAAAAFRPSTVGKLMENLDSVLSPSDREAMQQHLGEWFMGLRAAPERQTGGSMTTWPSCTLGVFSSRRLVFRSSSGWGNTTAWCLRVRATGWLSSCRLRTGTSARMTDTSPCWLAAYPRYRDAF